MRRSLDILLIPLVFLVATGAPDQIILFDQRNIGIIAEVIFHQLADAGNQLVYVEN